MELEELKKSWNALDEHLKDKEFIKEEELEKLIKLSTNLNDGNLTGFHTKMWIFCHGIATLLASGTVKLTDEQIKNLLTSEFQALMLLEDNSSV